MFLFQHKIISQIVMHMFLFYFEKNSSKKDDALEEEYTHLLCRFVVNGNGFKVGETISIDNDMIIIKSADKFLGVPLKHIEEQGSTLLVKGLIDFDKAYELGESWKATHLPKQNEKNHDGVL